MDIPRPASRRQQEIAALVRETGRVAVEDLVSRFGVTPQTIRRDLNDLSEARLITRTHGGAVVASGVENLAYEARKLVAQSNKRRIGEAAAHLIPDHSSLFINLGTTTEEVAQAIAGRKGLLVITNNINVANVLYRNSGINLIIAGGSIRASDGGVVGQMAADVIPPVQGRSRHHRHLGYRRGRHPAGLRCPRGPGLTRHYRECPPYRPRHRPDEVQSPRPSAHRAAG